MTTAHMTPEEMVSRLLYRDGLMLIIDKPAGLSVHKGPKGGPSLEDHFDALRFGLPRLPSLAHRLDKETSGCLVLGHHRKALGDAGRPVQRYGKVGKTYWAVVEGGPEADEGGRIDLPLGSKLDDTRGWWMKHDPDGLPSSTTWKVMGRMSLSGGRAAAVPSPASGGGSGRGKGAAPFAASHPLPIPPPQAGEGAPTHRTPPPHLARARAADRPDPPAARALRHHGLADPRRPASTAAPRAAAAPTCICTRARSSCRSTGTAPPIRVIAPVPRHMQERLLPPACALQRRRDQASATDQ